MLWVVVAQATQKINDSTDNLVQAKEFFDSGLHSRDSGNIPGALSALHKAVILYQTNSPKTEALADALYQLAETYAQSETSKKGESYYRQALEIYAQLETASAKRQWAHCLNRLGVILVDQYTAQQPDKLQELLEGGFHGDWNDEEVLQKVMNQMDMSYPKQAVAYFQDAASVFRTSIQELGVGNKDTQLALATSLQNMAAASAQLGHMEKAISALEESIVIYEKLLLEELDQEVAQAMAEAFYSMADLYLQQGAYEMAKDRYRRSSTYNEACVETVPQNQSGI